MQDADQVKNSWQDYFYRIREQCPWSWAAWLKGEIEIVEWNGSAMPLGQLQARVYTVDLTNSELEQLADQLDQGPCEWLYSHSAMGPWATPVSVLIQQDRAELTRLRNKLEKP